MKRLPTRFLPRAAATARMAAHMGRATARRLVTRSDADDEAVGDALLQELDQLKGLAMKVGQIMSYMDVGLPEGTVKRLAQLQEGAEALPFEHIEALIAAELGAPPSELFDRFDPTPIAAASIGQVHRAMLDGAEVAVKVRYPGVRETLDGDLSQLRVIGKLASLASSVDGMALVTELHKRMLEECDYGAEARHQDAFARAFADDPRVTVPAVLLSHCSDGVLTTAWQGGARFEQARGWPEDERAVAGRTLAHFNYTSLLRDRRLQADPHPGNFLFGSSGSIVALDYGCVRTFEPLVVSSWRRLANVVMRGQRSAFLDAIVSTGQVPRPDRYDEEEGWALHRWMFEPYLSSHFRFERRWWLKGLKYTRPTAKNQRTVAIPPPWIWLMRMQWGLHAVLVRLHAEGDFRTELEEAMAASTTEEG